MFSLRDSVQCLEDEVEACVQAAELVQQRLDKLMANRTACQRDLEQRESKLKELEKQLEAWEEKWRLIGEACERLGDIAGDIAKARCSLEVDMRSTVNPTPSEDDGSSVQDQLMVLQQTHQAT